MDDNIEDEELALGIDLGTTYSCVAVLRNGEVEIIPNEIGENKTPSMVSFEENEILIGEQIESQLIRNPKNTIYSIKRLMGRDFDDFEIQKDIKSNFWTFDIVKPIIGTRPQIKIKKSNGNELFYFPEQISKLIIEKLLKSAKKYLDRPIKKAVITVPAYFNDAQRNATKLAATTAGLEVLRIINEPTAASLAYGLNKKLPKNEKSNLENEFFQKDNFIENGNNIINKNEETEKIVIVFDLGGGTLDITVLKILEEEIFEVIASTGDSHLGGDDFDKKIIDYCLKKFSNIYNINIDKIKEDTKAMNRLKVASEKAKIILSMEEKTTIYIDQFYENKILQVDITRKKFEEISQDLFTKLILPLDKVLDDAKIGVSQVNEIIFVGGSTKIPKINDLIRDYFYDININNSINPDETVAYGAAIQAAKLVGNENDIINDIILMDATTFSLGTNIENCSNDLNIKKKGPLMNIIIPRGTKIPFQKSQNYTNAYDNQEKIRFGVYEGEKKYVKDNHLLGEFILENLPKKKKGELNINVTFYIDVSGILFVNAIEKSQGINNSIKIVNDKGNISEQEIIKKLNESNKAIMSNIDLTGEENYKKEMNDYYKYYQNTYNRQEKFQYIYNFGKAVINYLNTFNDENSDILGNKYYLYIKTLFNSYNIGLNISEMVTKDYINEVIIESKKYINKLSSFRNINYQNYITLLKFFQIENRNNILFELVILVMKIFIREANNLLLSNKENNYSKYHAKYLFNNCLKISRLFIKFDHELALISPEIRNNHIKYIEICKKAIKKINDNSLKEINLIKKSKKLFNNSKNLNREELLLLLDNFRYALQNIVGINDSESEAFYLANIVKINYVILKNENYKELKNLAEQSVNVASIMINNVEKKNWFIEISNILNELNKKIEENKKKESENFEERIKKDNKKIFDEIKEYRNKSNVEFIEFILQKYPPKNNKNILKKNQTVKERWEQNKDNFLAILSGKYHTDHYKKNTEEEMLIYTIFKTILIEINSIREEININNNIID